MSAQPLQAPNHPLAAPPIAWPQLRNYMTNYDKSSVGMEEDQVDQEDQEAKEAQEAQEAQVDLINQTKPHPSNLSNPPQM